MAVTKYPLLAIIWTLVIVFLPSQIQDWTSDSVIGAPQHQARSDLITPTRTPLKPAKPEPAPFCNLTDTLNQYVKERDPLRPAQRKIKLAFHVIPYASGYEDAFKALVRTLRVPGLSDLVEARAIVTSYDDNAATTGEYNPRLRLLVRHLTCAQSAMPGLSLFDNEVQDHVGCLMDRKDPMAFQGCLDANISATYRRSLSTCLVEVNGITVATVLDFQNRMNSYAHHVVVSPTIMLLGEAFKPIYLCGPRSSEDMEKALCLMLRHEEKAVGRMSQCGIRAVAELPEETYFHHSALTSLSPFYYMVVASMGSSIFILGLCVLFAGLRERVNNNAVGGDGRSRRATAGLTSQEIDALKTEEIKEPEDDSALPTCSICMDELEVGEVVWEFPCPHRYHQDCIGVWLERKNECPDCRQPVLQRGGEADVL